MVLELLLKVVRGNISEGGLFCRRSDLWKHVGPGFQVSVGVTIKAGLVKVNGMASLTEFASKPWFFTDVRIFLENTSTR